jgi:hypothetical protein
MRHEVDDAAVEGGGIEHGDVATRVRLTCTRLAPLAPASRARRVSQAAGASALVAACRRTLRRHACRARTRSAAVALAAVAATAQQHLCAATRAREQAGGMVDQLPAPREDTPEAHGQRMLNARAAPPTTRRAYTARASRFIGAV